MASPTELDLFKRSLSGDRRARTELYKKFVYGSARVRRLGTGYPDPTDFLHDCFSNVLRTGRSFEKTESLTKWVEAVAVWTALANARQRDMQARGAQGEFRMCAEMEGEDVTRGEVLSAYAPPLAGEADCPAARVLSLLNDSERTVFRKRVMETARWEETAAAAGIPLNAVGQIFARVTARVARLFGAPPPMDDDLVPVVSRVFAKPMNPEGRAVSLQLDAAFYTLTPEMHSIGVKTGYEARIVVLWDAAQGATPAGEALLSHLDKCHYCTDLLRSFTLMQQALVSPPGVPFYLCPGAFTLSNAADLDREAFDGHLAACPICREERTQALEGIAGESPQEQNAGGPGKKLAWTVAALLIVGGAFAGFYHFSHPQGASAISPFSSDPPQPTVALDSRYKDLVQNIPMDDAGVLASVLPANRDAMKFALNQYSLGQPEMALTVTAEVTKKSKDPGAETIYAMSLFRTMLLTDAYREMSKAEAMAPRDALRCWIMMQFALAVADKPVVEREAKHLADSPQYKDRAQKTIERVRERG